LIRQEKKHKERDGKLKEVEKNLESFFSTNMRCQLSYEYMFILKDLDPRRKSYICVGKGNQGSRVGPPRLN